MLIRSAKQRGFFRHRLEQRIHQQYVHHRRFVDDQSESLRAWGKHNASMSVGFSPLRMRPAQLPTSQTPKPCHLARGYDG
jgi:hypothetical protein